MGFCLEKNGDVYRSFWRNLIIKDYDYCYDFIIVYV